MTPLGAGLARVREVIEQAGENAAGSSPARMAGSASSLMVLAPNSSRPNPSRASEAKCSRTRAKSRGGSGRTTGTSSGWEGAAAPVDDGFRSVS